MVPLCICLCTNKVNGERIKFLCVLVCLQIIILKYTDYAWVAELIQVFVAVSVTVSFLVMGSAMKHTSMSLLEPVASVPYCAGHAEMRPEDSFCFNVIIFRLLRRLHNTSLVD